MVWVVLGAIAVIVGAGLSIAASRDSRRDVDRGQPSFYSVADVTGIWSRSRLDRLLGPRDADDRYSVTAEQVYAIPQTLWKRLFDNRPFDLACICVAIASPFLYGTQAALSVGLLALAGMYIATGYIGATVVVLRGRAHDNRDEATRD
jgi:hypothetical protein